MTTLFICLGVVLLMGTTLRRWAFTGKSWRIVHKAHNTHGGTQVAIYVVKRFHTVGPWYRIHDSAYEVGRIFLGREDYLDEWWELMQKARELRLELERKR